MLHRSMCHRFLLTLVFFSPLGVIAQTTDSSTSVADSEASVAPLQVPISTTVSSLEEISSLLPASTPPPVEFKTAIPPEQETRTAIRPPTSSAVDQLPKVTAPPYKPGEQQQSTTTSRINVAPPSDPEGQPALRPDSPSTNRDSQSSRVIASTAPPGNQEKESSVRGTKSVPAIVTPPSSPGSTRVSQALQATGPGASSQAPGASQATAVPASGLKTQSPPANSNVPVASAVPADSNAASQTMSGGAIATDRKYAGSKATPTSGSTDGITSINHSSPKGGAATRIEDNTASVSSTTSSRPAEFSGSANHNGFETSRGFFFGLIGLVIMLV